MAGKSSDRDSEPMSRESQVFAEINQATANGPCGDWTSYHDQKCFKIIAAVGTQQEAMAACKQLDSHSTLPTIKSLDENTFIYNMVKPYASQATSIWLGTLYLSNTFQWVDHTAISYKNYAYPANIHNQCMQMSLHITTLTHQSYHSL
ncbi:unnamed protein product [Oppiella nova]|uniref:C-type lectin domain-containing protein n=1 Tax=Oppiella nova TaxID=334625 RepID=A0A7R9QPF4_9ACAR|nr:unnamed protein product [Oppiella nova]CAG2170603.1 unnamed protein product [Oppiella nova]